MTISSPDAERDTGTSSPRVVTSATLLALSTIGGRPSSSTGHRSALLTSGRMEDIQIHTLTSTDTRLNMGLGVAEPPDSSSVSFSSQSNLGIKSRSILAVNPTGTPEKPSVNSSSSSVLQKPSNTQPLRFADDPLPRSILRGGSRWTPGPSSPNTDQGTKRVRFAEDLVRPACASHGASRWMILLSPSSGPEGYEFAPAAEGMPHDVESSPTRSVTTDFSSSQHYGAVRLNNNCVQGLDETRQAKYPYLVSFFLVVAVMAYLYLFGADKSFKGRHG